MAERRTSMEKLKAKHDHSFTDKVKGMIFIIMLLAPLLAILVECMIAIYNPNATNTTNVFYTAVSNMNSSTLFNWTTSTAIYAAINNMLTGLELGTGTTTLAILLTYWALMTAIYIVFDIIIFCFTKITHLIQ